MGLSKFIELQLVEELNVLNAMLAIEKWEDVHSRMDKLSYPTVRPIPSIQEGLVEIKESFEAKEYEVCSTKITELVDKLNRNIFDFKCTESWFGLERTIHKNVRYCNSCGKNVYKIENEFDLKKHVQANDCIFYLGEVETPKSCQITDWGKEVDPYSLGTKGLMGSMDRTYVNREGEEDVKECTNV